MPSFRDSVIADKPVRWVALVESALVIMIWASSYVIIRIGVGEGGQLIKPFTLAGMRYTLGALVLMPFVFRVSNPFKGTPPWLWGRMFLLGVSSYTVANGALYWASQYISSTTTSFILSLVPVLTLFASSFFLNEKPTSAQIAGVLVGAVGSLIFFAQGFKGNEFAGIAVMGVGILGFVAFAVLGRGLARSGHTDALTMTAFPLLFGGAVIWVIALITEGLPDLSFKAWFIVGWLTLINTAFAYTIYNHSLRVLTAVEMGVMRNTSPLWTAFFAWLLTGELLRWEQWLGIVVVIVGVTLVQWRR
jgi:drug/metabolite transporter (DMT)-like permease